MITLFISCSDDQKSGRTIGSEYLESQTYRQFEQDYMKEQTYRTDEDTVFVRILRSMHKQYRDREISLPFKFDTTSLDEYVRPSNRISVDVDAVKSSVGPLKHYTLYPVGVIQKNSYGLLFFISKQFSVYRDMHLVMAVVSDLQSLKVRAIAPFKNTLDVYETSKVQIDRYGTISVDVRRKVKYPVNQQLEMHYTFKVDGHGNIRSAQ